MAKDKEVKMGRPKSESPKTSPVTIRLDQNDYNKLKTYAEMHSKTMTQVLLEGLEMVYSK